MAEKPGFGSHAASERELQLRLKAATRQRRASVASDRLSAQSDEAPALSARPARRILDRSEVSTMQPELLCQEIPCDFCGARLEITAAEFASEPQPHSYVCPQCGKHHEIVTTGPPHVRVLAPRTDGRTGGYSQTMF
jgi:hypothetical protein